MEFLRVFVHPLWISPQVYLIDILWNKPPISCVKFLHKAYDNLYRGANVYISQGKNKVIVIYRAFEP